MCKEKKEPLRECTRIILAQKRPSPTPFHPILTVSFTSRHRCHTVRGEGLWKAHYLTWRCKKCIQSGSHFHRHYLQRWRCLCHVIYWAALKSARLSPNLPNLENIRFFSFKSVFLLQRFCHCADYVTPEVTAQSLSQGLDKLEHE